MANNFLETMKYDFAVCESGSKGGMRMEESKKAKLEENPDLYNNAEQVETFFVLVNMKINHCLLKKTRTKRFIRSGELQKEQK